MYDLKICILSMSVAKILSDVNCLQMIFDLTNSVLEWTSASSWLDLMRCIFHSTILSTVTNARGIFNFHSYYVETLRTFRDSEFSMKYSIFTT